jgi:hypothetical protein
VDVSSRTSARIKNVEGHEGVRWNAGRWRSRGHACARGGPGGSLTRAVRWPPFGDMVKSVHYKVASFQAPPSDCRLARRGLSAPRDRARCVPPRPLLPPPELAREARPRTRPPPPTGRRPSSRRTLSSVSLPTSTARWRSGRSTSIPHRSSSLFGGRQPAFRRTDTA